MKPPRFSSGRIQLTGDWPVQGGAVLIPAGTFLSFSHWQWRGQELPWPPPVSCVALDQASHDELLKHYEPHRVSYQPQEIGKFGGERKPSKEASMSNIGIEQMIEHATALSKTLPQMADQLIAALTAMKDERDAIEEDLNERREEHRQVEASIAVARRELADIEAERKRIHAMFARAEKSDAA
jgi:hypothetical protein